MKTVTKHIDGNIMENTCNSHGNMYSWVTSEMVSSLTSFQKQQKLQPFCNRCIYCKTVFRLNRDKLPIDFYYYCTYLFVVCHFFTTIFSHWAVK